MRRILLVLILSLAVKLGTAQRTLSAAATQSLMHTTKTAFQQERWEIACPDLERIWLEQGSNLSSTQTIAWQEIKYSRIVCHLWQNSPGAETDALAFIHESSVGLWRNRVHFFLGNFYFKSKQWIAALAQYRQAAIENLSNEEIAQLQFNQGYAFFALKKYEEARPLFNSIRQLPTGKYRQAATYYYGILLFEEGKLEEAQLIFKQLEQDATYGRLAIFYNSQLALTQGDFLLTIDKLEKNAHLYQDTTFPAWERKQLLGRAYFQKGDYANAMLLLTDYVLHVAEITRVDQFELAYAQLQQGKYAAAVEGFKRLIAEKDSLAGSSLFHLGEAQLQLNNKTEARSAFSLCMSTTLSEGLKAKAQFNFAKLSYELGYYDAAAREMDGFIQQNTLSPLVGTAREILFASLAASSNYKKALWVVEQMDKPTAAVLQLVPSVRYGRAVELFYDGELLAAKQLFLKVLATSSPTTWHALSNFWLGEIAYQQKEGAMAVQYLNKYLSMGAPTAGEATPIHAYYNLGYALLSMNQPQASVGQFEKVKYGPVMGNTSLELDARLRIADCQLLLRQYKAARQNYQFIVDIETAAAPYAYYQLALIAGVESVNEKINRLIQLRVRYPASPYVSVATMSLADAYMEGERFAEALPLLEQLLAQASPASQPAILSKLAVVAYNLDDNEKALLFYQRLIEQYPNSEEAADALEEMKAVYIELGRATEYTSYLKNRGIAVAVRVEDSLYYLMAEKLIEAKEYKKAAYALQQYIDSFPAGNYKAEALYQLATCYNQQKEWQLAISPLQQLLAIEKAKHELEANFLLARLYFFELKNYERSIFWYARLLPLTDKTEDRLEILRALVRAAYQQQNWLLAKQYGDSLRSLKEKSKDDQALIALTSAKFLIEQGKEVEGQQELANVLLWNKAAWAAEARFELAASYYRLRQWKLAEKTAFETINKSGSYEKWVTRSYLLLGDIYFEQKDYFNARATYQSVYENATDEIFKKAAAEKLEEVNKKEAPTRIP
jgi:TolA-binding protein